MIVGIGKISGISIGGATMAIFDVPTARAILDQPGFDEISVAAKPGVSEARVGGGDPAAAAAHGAGPDRPGAGSR